MAHDSGHSHPLFARVGNTEYVIAWLKLPVKTSRPIDEGEQPENPEVVDLDKEAVEMLRRRLGLQSMPEAADSGANVRETGQRQGTGSEIKAETKSEAEKGRQPQTVQGYGKDK
jgi:hypothetical protein